MTFRCNLDVLANFRIVAPRTVINSYLCTMPRTGLRSPMIGRFEAGDTNGWDSAVLVIVASAVFNGPQ